MTDMKGHKTPTVGAQAEGESRNSGAKSKHPKPEPKTSPFLPTKESRHEER